jgi:hypothetical protein
MSATFTDTVKQLSASLLETSGHVALQRIDDLAIAGMLHRIAGVMYECGQSLDHQLRSADPVIVDKINAILIEVPQPDV